MQIQISNIINRINKHNKRGYTYSFKVHHLQYVINYSFLRVLRNLRNLHRKPQVTRNFATLDTVRPLTCILQGYLTLNVPRTMIQSNDWL